MLTLNPNVIYQINLHLAKEFINERLDAEATDENIEKLATCITEIEKQY